MSRKIIPELVSLKLSQLAQAMADWPQVTVNILSFNRCSELRINLTKLSTALDYPAEKLEIIVVDNGSTDGSREMVRREFPQVQLVENPNNVGISGWNDGFKCGAGPFFLVLDDDCYIEGMALRHAVAAAVETGADLVSFTVANPNEPGFYFNLHVNPGLLSFWGCAALIRRSAIQQLGGFDPGIFVYMHELEFSIRFLDAGFTHLFLPAVVAQHMKAPGTSTSSTERMMRRCAFNHGHILAKLFPGGVLARQVIWALLGYARRDIRRPGLAFKQAASFLSGLRSGWRCRSSVRRSTADFYSDYYASFAPPVLSWGQRRQRVEKEAAVARAAYYPHNQAALLRLEQRTPLTH